MKVTENDVLYVADLANLDLTATERSSMIEDLNSILGYVDMLSELDTTGVEPLAAISSLFAGEGSGDRQHFAHALREDHPKPSLPHDIAMSNAPDTDGSCFKVPKVIER